LTPTTSHHPPATLSRQVEDENFGALPVRELDLPALELESISRVQALPIGADAAARHVDVALAIRCQRQLGALSPIEQPRV
jgi:hypothetical protein